MKNYLFGGDQTLQMYGKFEGISHEKVHEVGGWCHIS